MNCSRNFRNHESYKEKYDNGRHSYHEITQNVKEQIRKDGSLNNLDSILQHTCYQSLDMDFAYNITIDFFDFCYEQKVTFTPAEILIVKEKLRKRFCYINTRERKKCAK